MRFVRTVDLIILDTRNYDRSITDLGWNEDYIPEIMNDAGRTLMGSIQENWFYNSLKRSASRGAIWNWVADLVWLDEKDYDSDTGAGALGVEFAGTAVSSTSSFGANATLWECNNQSRALVADNPELQWQEGYYRGYYEMQISKERILASYFGTPSLQTRNGFEVSLANFTVEKNANRLSRPVGGGSVESGALLSGGLVATSNLTLDTNTGEWFVHNITKVNLVAS